MKILVQDDQINSYSYGFTNKEKLNSDDLATKLDRGKQHSSKQKQYKKFWKNNSKIFNSSGCP